MKYLWICLIVIPFLSCENNDNVTINESDVIEDSTTTSIEEPVPDEETFGQTIDKGEFKLEDFPKKWYRLDPKEGNSEELVINNYCEAEIQQLWIEPNNNEDWDIAAILGQDSDTYKLLEFKATAKEMELYDVVTGTIKVEKAAYMGGGIETYEFTWNRDLKFCFFDGFFGKDVMMVSEQNKDAYEIVEENCDYLNEEY